MLAHNVVRALRSRPPSVCSFCAAQLLLSQPIPQRLLSSTTQRPKTQKDTASKHTELTGTPPHASISDSVARHGHDKSSNPSNNGKATARSSRKSARKRKARLRRVHSSAKAPSSIIRKILSKIASADHNSGQRTVVNEQEKPHSRKVEDKIKGISLKEALTGSTNRGGRGTPPMPAILGMKKKEWEKKPMQILRMSPDDLEFKPMPVELPQLPMLGHGLDRVLFNPGVYRLQDPRSRVYNFDPYLEKIMPANEFDFDSVESYKTSSKDETLISITKEQHAKFTGSTSSMSGILTHFHYLLSHWRELDTSHFSKRFPVSLKFSKIQRVPAAIYMRWKDGIYAIDADKEYDSPNIMSWLGQSMERLLTTTATDFERYRRSSLEKDLRAPDASGRAFHYSQLGNVIMRSQLDAHDPRLPGTGVFDLKTRAVVTVRMDRDNFESASGYQLHYDHGEWESYEREYHDMMRATMLKYSLQVRMGRMDGIFIAYHNVERIFGFQYVGLPEMDQCLHGQTDVCLGDQEFKMSVQLLSKIMERASQQYPETSIRLHVETREGKVPFMYIFAEPMTEEEIERIQNNGSEVRRDFEKTFIGLHSADDSKTQAEWQDIQGRVDEELIEDQMKKHSDAAATESSQAEGQSPEEDVSIEDREPIDMTVEETQEHSDEETEGHNSHEASEEHTADGETDTNPKKPVMGWTLTIRNKVNGAFVMRPVDLGANDDWTIEYNVQEIPQHSIPRLYDMMRKRRRALLFDKEKQDKDRYFKVLRSYSQRGRKWRQKQDLIDQQTEKRVYVPLGPGSDEAKKN